MTSPADELRTAAEKIRALVAAISPPNPAALPFHADDAHVTQGEFGLYDVATAETPECAAYIAAMGPPVGLALTDWLDDTAGQLDAMPFPVTHAPALAVARAINGNADG